MILKVKTSEPRDALQSERTCLSFVRFATTLFVTSFGMLINFKLNSDTNIPDHSHSSFANSTYIKVLTYLLIVISILISIVAGISYLITIKRYKLGKIDNFGFNNFMNGILMFGLILILIFVNVSLMIESFGESA